MATNDAEKPVTGRNPTRLSFRVFDEIQDRELPLEIRRSDSALVARSRSREEVLVEPGDYTVLGRFPNGGEVRGHISIGPDDAPGNRVVELTSVSFPPRSRGMNLHTSGFIGKGVQPTTRGLESLGTIAAPLRSELFSFDADDSPPPPSSTTASLKLLRCTLSGDSELEPVKLEPNIDRDGGFKIPVENPTVSKKPRWLRFERVDIDADDTDGKLVYLWSVPDAVVENAKFEFDDSPIGLAPRLENDQASLVLDYLNQGAASEAKWSVDSVSMSAEKMLEEKRWDPLAAALGAYVLLRGGKLKSPRTQAWAGHLRKLNPGFPDAYCIHGEVLGRQGKLVEAIDELLHLDHLGLPFFSDGLSFACACLSGSLRDPNRLDEKRRTKVLRLLTRLNWLGAHRVLGEPVLVLKGLDPLDPDHLAEWKSIDSDDLDKPD